ncbi:MAG: hypothetical protein P4L90_11705 [Rhodopila sp.]|nr:hypothetical protein [Rhodopila sp.]
MGEAVFGRLDALGAMREGLMPRRFVARRKTCAGCFSNACRAMLPGPRHCRIAAIIDQVAYWIERL